MKIKLHLLATIALVVGLFACSGETPFLVSAQFATPQGIEVGDALYFEGRQIGEVTQANATADGQSVTVRLNPQEVGYLSGASALVVNRMTSAAHLEIYNRGSAQEEVLQNGQVVQGLDSMLQLGAWMIGDAIQLGTRTLSEYVESFRDYLDSEAFEEDKAQVRTQLDSVREQANSAIEQIGTELKETSKQLVESEKAATSAVRELSQELVPMVSDLKANSRRLAQELKEFTESLEAHSEDERIAGEAFVESLLETLQQLNQAMNAEPDAVEGSDADTDSAAETELDAEPELDGEIDSEAEEKLKNSTQQAPELDQAKAAATAG